MTIQSALETSPAINTAAIESYIVSLWQAAAKYESWERTTDILGAFLAVTDGDLFDEIACLLWLAYERDAMAAQQVKQCGEFLDIDDGYKCLEVSQ